MKRDKLSNFCIHFLIILFLALGKFMIFLPDFTRNFDDLIKVFFFCVSGAVFLDF